MRKKINWERIRNLFITWPDPFNSELPKILGKTLPFTYFNFGREFGIIKSTIHLRATTLDSDGVTWASERLKYFRRVQKKVQDKQLTKDVNKEEKRKKLVDSTENLITNMSKQIDKFFKDNKEIPFETDELTSFIKAFEIVKKNYAKLINLIDTGGTKQIIFNINVPVTAEFLTQAGVEYVEKMRGSKQIIDVECEVE